MLNTGESDQISWLGRDDDSVASSTTDRKELYQGLALDGVLYIPHRPKGSRLLVTPGEALGGIIVTLCSESRLGEDGWDIGQWFVTIDLIKTAPGTATQQRPCSIRSHTRRLLRIRNNHVPDGPKKAASTAAHPAVQNQARWTVINHPHHQQPSAQELSS